MAIKSKSVRYDTIRSFKGVAGYNYLGKKADTYDPDKPKHRVQLFILDPKDAEFKAFCAKLVATQKTYLTSIKAPQVGTVPGLKKADERLAKAFGEYGVVEGTLYFEFTTKAKMGDDGEFVPVPTYNVRGQQDPDVQVYSGDVIRVSTTLSGYNTGTMKGIKCYLNSVQMIEKRNSGGGGSAVNVFEDESGNAETVAEEAPFVSEEAETQTEAKPAAKSGKRKTVKPAATKPAPKAEPAGDVDLSDLV